MLHVVVLREFVWINLDQPVVERFWFCNNWFNVQRDGLHLLCNECELYGHIDRKHKLVNTNEFA